VALDKFGVQVTALVAGISVAGVAVGFAIQDILANLAAGLSIMLSRHFRIGDYIEIGNTRGQVQSIDLTMTVLRTLEDARVIVPNRKIVGEIIYNYTGERRVTLTLQVGYKEDLDRVMGAVRDALAENPRILTTPPEVGITRLADSGIQITLRPWCKAEDYWRVQYEVYRAIVERFREQQIDIPYPHREVRLLPAAAWKAMARLPGEQGRQMNSCGLAGCRRGRGTARRGIPAPRHRSRREAPGVKSCGTPGRCAEYSSRGRLDLPEHTQAAEKTRQTSDTLRAGGARILRIEARM
jgi:small conductance mechanosensitive channel